MPHPIRYSGSKDDVFFPAKRGEFFARGVPKSESALCAELSRLAYCRLAYPPAETNLAFDEATIRTVLAGAGFQRCRFFRSEGKARGEGTQCLLAERDDSDESKKLAVVAFRGTDKDDPTDVAADLDARLTKWDAGGRVHEGFHNALSEVRGNVVAAVQAITCRTLITGHSLGAALATLLASLVSSLAGRCALYTFGSPQTGDAEFVDTLRGVDCHRYVDCCDVITRLPGFGDYKHVGKPWYIDRNRKVKFCPSRIQVAYDRFHAEAAYLAAYAWKTENVGVRAVADHAPINYVWAIEAAATQ